LYRTENAERECRQVVRRFLRQNPDAFIIVTGCYAQLRPEEISAIKGVDAILGNSEKFNIFSLIDDSKNRTFLHLCYSHQRAGRIRSCSFVWFRQQNTCLLKNPRRLRLQMYFLHYSACKRKSRSMNPDDAVQEFRKIARCRIQRNYSNRS